MLMKKNRISGYLFHYFFTNSKIKQYFNKLNMNKDKENVILNLSFDFAFAFVTADTNEKIR